jgi:multiple sugar transport system permease protein
MLSQDREVYYGLTDVKWSRRPWQGVQMIISYVVLGAGAVIFLLPFFWMLSTSLKAQSAVYTLPPTFFPNSFLWQNFPEGWTHKNTMFPLWTWNTLLITFGSMAGVLLTSSLCAYGFARLQFKGRDFWFMAVLASIMLPGPVTLIPLYVGYSRIGWLNTFNPLIIPSWFGGGAFNIFLLRQFFKGIPIELEEAAVVDGASRFRIWWQIFLPLSKPALATIAVFTFQGHWNDFYGPLIFLSTLDKYTLALGINSFKGLYSTQVPLMMAMSFLMVIPMIIVFFFAQKLMIRGVVLSGIKG